jgi:hypothetical protein
MGNGFAFIIVLLARMIADREQDLDGGAVFETPGACATPTLDT